MSPGHRALLTHAEPVFISADLLPSRGGRELGNLVEWTGLHPLGLCGFQSTGVPKHPVTENWKEGRSGASETSLNKKRLQGHLVHLSPQCSLRALRLAGSRVLERAEWDPCVPRQLIYGGTRTLIRLVTVW